MNPIVHWLAIARVAARNAVPLIGILFDGWSAANVVVLYFLDTLLSLAVIFAGLAKTFAPATVSGPLRLELTCAAVALLLCALFALPLGLPVGIALASSQFSFGNALSDRSLRIGALVQCAIAAWSYVELRRALRSHSAAELKLKQRFGIVLLRWAALLAACYLGLEFAPDRALLLLLVATYVAVSVAAEIAPARLLRGTPADEGEAPRQGPRGL